MHLGPERNRYREEHRSRRREAQRTEEAIEHMKTEPKKENQACQNCMHRYLVKEHGRLICRRYPPVAIVQPNPDPDREATVHGINPPVAPEGKCGEYAWDGVSQ